MSNGEILTEFNSVEGDRHVCPEGEGAGEDLTAVAFTVGN